MTKDEVNEKFDQQIKFDKKFKVDKALFNLTLDFSIDDWKFIRTKKYYDTIDKLSYDAKKIYTLKCVKYYLANFK